MVDEAQHGWTNRQVSPLHRDQGLTTLLAAWRSPFWDCSVSLPIQTVTNNLLQHELYPLSPIRDQTIDPAPNDFSCCKPDVWTTGRSWSRTYAPYAQQSDHKHFCSRFCGEACQRSLVLLECLQVCSNGDMELSGPTCFAFVGYALITKKSQKTFFEKPLFPSKLSTFVSAYIDKVLPP